MTASLSRGDRWTFLTNHARVLLHIARDPEVRLRDVAASIGITERATQAIVADLEAAGYLSRTRVGRRNRYTVDPTVSLRHPSEADHPVGDLLDTFLHREAPPASTTSRAAAPGEEDREASGA
ncbi:helix-turn-helix transcriptional regulator [Streptomyces fenghuangensis]|uniref:helix-turn-helix transcriptional regulator n=1 Tax=Streptomyces sp. ICN903 TaxID=2964654 RepID=UPI001EDC23FE|nr:helix-turn-helix domain-containing protein [Streptomyces sp. ICN903]MCG3039026.1 MarR family transcriptional regulator [Streptomyces sp. ICN903]